MPTITTVYLGDLRTEITHVQSGNKVVTDAPTDNNGKGEYISPTDMVAAALGSCMLTLMDMAARRRDIDLRGTRLDITKIMAADPRRIAEIVIDFHIPGDYDEKDKLILERAADTCPVSKSLHPDIKQTVRYLYNAEVVK
ncbi:OsmC family protein [Alistipes sp. OttesenSCG-928-B03]|nr:OsmC family protein [Alistipes sp. OttesenSCG-928-B03]